LAVSEADGDWSVTTCQTSAVKVDGNYILNGTKSFVLDGEVADLILVLAQTPEGPSLFAVDGESPGLTRTMLKTLDATRKLALLDFKSVSARLIGVEGSGSSSVIPAVQTAIAALAVEQVGAANRCLEICVDYAKSRVQFGRPIGGFQAIKHKCANLLMHVESSRSAAYYAAWAVAEGSDDVSLASSLAKAYCSDTFNLATADMIQILGGIGFTWEHDAHLYYRRSRSSALLFGSPQRHRDVLAGLLLDAVNREDAQS
jgi:alkylation response protein AidB-like acyl-CoA dehydrogenase